METLENFWEKRFQALYEEISKCFDYRGLIEPALAILPFDKQKYRYCSFSKGYNFRNLEIPEGLSNRRFPLGRSSSGSLSFQELKENVSKQMESNCVDLIPFFSKIKELQWGHRKEAYDILCHVEFPQDSISKPTADFLNTREDKFKFIPYTSYKQDLMEAYYLDHIVFPYSHVALWHIALFQPVACVFFYSEIKNDSDLSEYNKELVKQIMPKLKEWEGYVESELYAFRITSFINSLNHGAVLRKKEHLPSLLKNAIPKLINSENIFIMQKGKEDKNVTYDYPSVDREINYDFYPCFEFGEWNKVLAVTDTALEKNRQDIQHRIFLWDQAYQMILSFTQFYLGLIERNNLLAASDLLNFLAKPESSSNFLNGLRILFETTKNLSNQINGTWTFRELHNILKDKFSIDVTNDGVPHNLGDSLNPNEDYIEKLLKDIFIEDAIKMLDVFAKTTELDGLLIPILNYELFQVESNGLDCPGACLFKAWSSGCLWLPHVNLSHKSALTIHDYQSQKDNYKKRIVLKFAGNAERIRIEENILRILKSLRNLCKTFSVSQICINEIVLSGDKKYSIIFKCNNTEHINEKINTLNSGAKKDSLNEETASGDLTEIGFYLNKIVEIWEFTSISGESRLEAHLIYNDKFKVSIEDMR